MGNLKLVGDNGSVLLSLEDIAADSVVTVRNRTGTLADDTDIANLAALVLQENDCINGTFDIWQRYPGSAATIPAAAETHVADRFGSFRTVGSSLVVDQKTFVPGQTAVPGNPEFYHEGVFVTDSAATEENYHFLRIKDVGKYSGKTIAVQFFGKADSGKDVAVETTQNFGSGGSVSVQVDVETVSLTTYFAKKIFFVTIPSISGKTVGTSSYTEFKVWLTAGSNFDANTNSLGNQSGTLNMSEIKIYPSSSSIELAVRRRTPGESLNLCLDYCRKSYEDGTPPGAVTSVSCLRYRHQDSISRTGITGGSFSLDRPMIKTPSVIFYSTNSGTAGYLYNTGTTFDVVATPTGTSPKQLWSGITLGTAVANGENLEWHFLASSEL